MTWAAIAVGVVGAGVSAYSANKANKANKKATANAGQVDITTRNDPYAPSIPYRDQGAAFASDLLGRSRDGLNAPAPSAPLTPSQKRNARRQAAQGGGGGGGTSTPAFNGTSDTTQGAIDAVNRRAQQGHALYDPSTDYVTGVLAGDDTNDYRSGAYDRFQGMADQDDPYLARYMEELFGNGGGGAGGHGGGAGGGGGMVFASGGGGGGPAQIGADKYIKETLEGKWLSEENPYKAEMIARTSKAARDEFENKKIPGVNDAFTGAGRFGGGMYREMRGRAADDFSENLTDSIGDIEYQEYEARMADRAEALGLGTTYDMHAQDVEAQNNASASAAGSSYYAANSAAENARQQNLLTAIGMNQAGKQFGAQGMGSIGADFGLDQRGALGMVPELSGLDLRDLSAGANLGIGADANRVNLSSARMQADAQRAAANASSRAGIMAVKNQQANYLREAPWMDAMRYADIINAQYGGYGSQNVSGIDQRNVSPAAYISPGGQAIAGGLAGYGAVAGNR